MIKTTMTCDHKANGWTSCRSTATVSGGVTNGVMMYIASEEGWVSIRGDGDTRDYCPQHAPMHPTHGTVEDEMLGNGYIQCRCGKMHLPTTGTVVCECGRSTLAWEQCR